MSESQTLVAGDTGAYPKVFLRDRADTNADPVAELSLSQNGRRVVADARASNDPDGATVTATIHVRRRQCGAERRGRDPRLERAGTYGVTVTIKDADGATTMRSATVTIPDVSSPLPPVIGPPAGGVLLPGPGLPGPACARDIRSAAGVRVAVAQPICGRARHGPTGQSGRARR